MKCSGPRLRSVAFLATGVLVLPGLAACGGDSDRAAPAAPGPGPDIRPAARDQVREGSTLRWAVDSVPATLNTFQADADATSSRVASAVLPSMFTLDRQGRPVRSADFLDSAEVVRTEPRQVVEYHLSAKATWNNGREIGAPDFVAQWQALRGKSSAYWTARNAGYERIEKIERGRNDLTVLVTFAKPYADWRALFSPLYPREVMGSPDTFNDGARNKLAVSAGPFQVAGVDRDEGEVTLTRNPRWWGARAKLDKVELLRVRPADRTEALLSGTVDLAEIQPEDARRVALAARDRGGSGPLAHGPGAGRTPAEALRSWAVAHGSGAKAAEAEQRNRAALDKARARYAAEQKSLGKYRLRKTLQPAYTQLALNGESGPLADERVRRAVARAIDRQSLADFVLKPLGLPARTVGSHLALAGQQGYQDNSGALGDQDTVEAQALLADAGWTRPEGGRHAAGGTAGGAEATGSPEPSGSPSASGTPETGASATGDDGSEDDGKPGREAPARKAEAEKQAEKKTERKGAEKAGGAAHEKVASALGEGTGLNKAAGAAGAYAPKGTPAPQAPPAGAQRAPGLLDKDGKQLTLRFVLPTGAGTETLRSVGEKIAGMLEKIGIRTDISRVPEAGFFKDHVASGEYDMALYSWPGTAFPATDARPVYGKPVPAADGSLNVDQNYTRVGTDRIDQLLDQAAGTLDEKEAHALMRKADARIWAAAGSVPLYQRPELVAARPDVVNAGAFGFTTPVWQDLGFSARKSPAGGAPAAPSGAPTPAGGPGKSTTEPGGNPGKQDKTDESARREDRATTKNTAGPGDAEDTETYEHLSQYDESERYDADKDYENP
ncbi:ABC transporter family substrate-binding protein [Streptomyces sp. NPDC007088]|uniref:ABC transporter family substrate-binding protein n=1 Tax=Streptomyces sp. NPDC007088 TaxID=3364773 RepID=UPI003678E8D0